MRVKHPLLLLAALPINNTTETAPKLEERLNLFSVHHHTHFFFPSKINRKTLRVAGRGRGWGGGGDGGSFLWIGSFFPLTQKLSDGVCD